MLEKGISEVRRRLDEIDKKLKAHERTGEDVKKLRRRWKEAKAAAVHDPGSAAMLIDAVGRQVQ
jgi:hypothetical protein